jgi:hypothetical protein
MHEKDLGDQKISRTVSADRDVQEIRSRESRENEKSAEEKITDKQIKTANQEFTHRHVPLPLPLVSIITLTLRDFSC